MALSCSPRGRNHRKLKVKGGWSVALNTSWAWVWGSRGGYIDVGEAVEGCATGRGA